MKVWIKAGVIIFYVLIYSFLRKRMRRDFIKFFKAMMLLMIFILSLLPEAIIIKQLGLLPAGALLPIIANHKVKWCRALLFGVLVSAVIETSQLVFMRGLFEWDDMIHNGLGCMIGSMIINFFMKNKIRD